MPFNDSESRSGPEFFVALETLRLPGALWSKEVRLMEILPIILIWVTAVFHVVFAVMEMYPWKRPCVFDQVKLPFDPPYQNEVTAAHIVHNAGLYNVFIAAGLIWSTRAALPESLHLSVFFLSCGILAGIFGTLTLTPKTLLLQTLPATAALVAVLLG
jgi:putative membrane protein